MAQMVTRSIMTALFAAGLALGGATQAAEYFVNKQGSDANDGLARERAFLTVQKGINALKPGDTLTIGPGEYFEAVRRENLGSMEAATIIRAEIPGTALLRGDKPAPAFARAEGYEYVWQADYDGPVQTVNEVDTLSILESVPSIAALELAPGKHFHDAAEKKLYISTSDFQPPMQHHYTVSVLSAHGLELVKPTRVTIDGIAVRGFNNLEVKTWHSYYTAWGIRLSGSRNCVVRRATVFLNGSGIAVHSDGEEAGGNLIEWCTAYGNYSRHSVEGGQIHVFSSNNDLVQHSYAYRGRGNGFRHYGAGIRGPAILRHNLAWGHDHTDFFVKGGKAPEFGLAEHCVSLGKFHCGKVNHNIIGTINQYNKDPGPDNIRYASEAHAMRDQHFADPENLDFRLQATSSFRGGGIGGADRGAFPYKPNIFYVKPDGNDQANGLSMRNAWQSLRRALTALRPGDTLYLAAGTYEADADLAIAGEGEEPASIRGRGTEPVVITGALRVRGTSGLSFERLHFAGTVSVQDSREIAANNCHFIAAATALDARNVQGLRLTHNVFTGFNEAALAMERCAGAFLAGNLFDNAKGPALRLDGEPAVLYSDYNSYRSERAVWRVKEQDVSFAAVQQRHDIHSRLLVPEFTVARGAAWLDNAHRFAAVGPHGTSIGPYHEFREREIRLIGPVVHSVSDTTANIEWRLSRPAVCEVAWGETGQAGTVEKLRTREFATMSLTGLKPGTTYSFTVRSLSPMSEADKQFTRDSAPAATVQFTTAAAPAAPVTYYVAPDGRDENSGLSRAEAWRTVSHAASRINAGDTVMIAGGTYSETVHVRATGTEGRPITFRAIPGERVLFDGHGREIGMAFSIARKHHVHLDNLYFRMFGNFPGGWDTIISLYDSNNARISRCFMDGTGGKGSSPHFLFVSGGRGFHMSNCVLTNGFQGLYTTGASDMLFEHNTFVRNLICPMLMHGAAPKSVRIRNNVFVDSIPSKVMVHLFELGGIDPYIFENNLFYLRRPDAERRPFFFYGTGPGRLSIADYEARTGYGGNLIGDPQFRISAGVESKDREGKKIEFLADWYVSQPNLDFPLFFPAHPECVQKGIGLQPEVFADVLPTSAGK